MALGYKWSYSFNLLGLSEGDRVEITRPKRFDLLIHHIHWDQVHWCVNLLATALERTRKTGQGAFVELRAFLVLITDQQAGSRLGDTDHLIHRGGFITKEVDPAHVEHRIESLVFKRQFLGGCQEEVHVPAATARERLAALELAGRYIQPKDHPRLAGFEEEGQIGSRSNGDLEDVTTVQLHALHQISAILLFATEEEEHRF